LHAKEITFNSCNFLDKRLDQWLNDPDKIVANIFSIESNANKARFNFSFQTFLETK